jgi:hypothetical protein
MVERITVHLFVDKRVLEPDLIMCERKTESGLFWHGSLS